MHHRDARSSQAPIHSATSGHSDQLVSHSDLARSIIGRSLEGETPRLLASVVVATRPSTGVSGEGVVLSRVVDGAISTKGNAVLVQVVGVEVQSRGEELEALRLCGGFVDPVLFNGVVTADLRVERTGENFAAEATLGGVDGFAVAVGTGAPFGG